MRPTAEFLLLRLAPPLISGVLRLIGRSLRIEYRGLDPLLERWQHGDPTLLSFWHNRVLLMPVVAARRKQRNESGALGICILNSLSRDGEIATRTLERWGVESVRGSTARGGAGGFLQLLRAHRRGLDLALVPDGSRGPRYVAKPGALHLARATASPLWPVSWAASRFIQLRSWDRLIVPLPFARVVFVAGSPLTVARSADDSEIEGARAELERRLNEASEIAERAIGRTTR